MPVDVQLYYAKLANNETISEEEIKALIRAYTTAEKTAAYLAECQAATLDGLPKSTSKSSRVRHIHICEVAAKALRGDTSGIRYPNSAEVAAERCDKAISRNTQLTS